MLAVLLAALESDADRQKFIEVYGRKNNVFDRDALTTRAEFSAMAARFSNSEYHGDKKFSDITGHWAENEIYRAAEQDRERTRIIELLEGILVRKKEDTWWCPLSLCLALKTPKLRNS